MSRSAGELEAGSVVLTDFANFHVLLDFDVAIGAVLNAAKKAASTSPEGVSVVREAWDLFNTIDKDQRNAFVYSSMIGALGQAKMRDEAVELFEEAASHLKPWCEAQTYSRAIRLFFAFVLQPPFL